MPSDAGKVNCKGVNPLVNKIDLTLTVDEKGVGSASALYTSLSDDGEEHKPVELEFIARDMQDPAIDFQHASFIFAHHNTVAKLVADGDIFGGSTEDFKETAPFNGVFFYQSGNANSAISRWNVVCRKM
jgi:hypothetical protein